ncbi:RIP metalloprotease RseP [Thermorudis peleae]|uniref:RIP metalloprotease RseP n=1 Tax=Thermorudis peleae TaxID=1382356 RepID=UPI00056F410A|nr:RIP metalloprotease RseP [Thermorudis peleae]
MSALYVIPILAFLILVHELGHFLAARLFGITVLEFGIGLPPRLFGIRRGGVLYSLNLIPLGGFVRVLGEDSRSLEPGSLQTKARWQRAIFFAAGALMNVVIAVILMMVLVAAQGKPEEHVYIAEVAPDSPAAAAGWQPGDRFLQVGGQTITSVDQLLAITQSYAGRPMPVVLQRGSQRIQSTVVPREQPPAGQGRTGVRIATAPKAHITVADVDPRSPAANAGIRPGDEVTQIGDYTIDDAAIYWLALERYAQQTTTMQIIRDGQPLKVTIQVPERSPAQSQLHIGTVIRQEVIARPLPLWQIPVRGIAQTFSLLGGMIVGLAMLLRGQASLSNVTGPIGIGQLTSELLAISPNPVWMTLANLTVLLSLNLAILNLIPFPALDGGRLFFVLVEAIRGRRIAPEKEGLVHLIGFIILLGFMFLIAFVDIGRILSGQSLVP